MIDTLSGNESEKNIIERIIDGDKDKFNDLINEYIDIVYGVIFSYTKNKENSEDLTQETFIKIYKSLSNFNFKSSFKTWIIRIAINTVKDYFKKCSVKNEISIAEFPDIPDFKNNPQSIIEEAEFIKFFDDTVMNMPENLKEIYILREREKYSYEDISRIIEKPVGTVESRIFYARKYIQKKFIEWTGM